MTGSKARMFVTYGPRTAIAVLEVHEPATDQWLVFTGDSKRHPDDRDDIGVGGCYAIARALQLAATYFKEYADSRLEDEGAMRTYEGMPLKILRDGEIVWSGQGRIDNPGFENEIPWKGNE